MPQGSEAWLLKRAGVPTASEWDAVISPKWKARTGEGRQTYLLSKVAEKLMGYPEQTWGGGAMEQGSILEGEARPWFEFTTGITVDRVGFCTTDDGRLGCSPDGLIGEDGGLEIKCPSPHKHLAYLVAGVVPDDYLAQVHGSMLVTGRAWWQFISYNRNFPALVLTVKRDEAIQAAMRAALDAFLADFDAALAKVNALIEANEGGGR